MSALRHARAAAFGLMAFAVAVALEAATFRVAFMTDPIGPRALPWLGAALVFAGAAAMALRPATSPAPAAPGSLPRVAVVVVAFIAYALVLELLGFVVATTLLVVTLSSLFGGRPVRSLIAAGVFSGALYLLFANVLGVPLPVGALFGG